MKHKIQNTKHNTHNCRIRVGTSGYSYTEWIEAGFYPAGTRSEKMLEHYAGIFPAAELNYTWYQMPKAPAVDRMRKKVPEHFVFAAKLTRTLTHEVDPKRWRTQVKLYKDGMAPLVQSGQLAAVLIQLPPFFDWSNHNRIYLSTLLDALSGLPLAVEFRHASWARDRVFKGLEKRNVTLVCVDEPDLPGLFPALDVVTNPDLFYIRFHGKNASGWRSGNMQKQFDYNYTENELAKWSQHKIPQMAQNAKKGIIFFNNHVRGQAPDNARRLVLQLTESGLV